MNLFITIILLLIKYINCAVVSCSNISECYTHTYVYLNYNNSNELSKLYLYDTYIIDNIDPCRTYTSQNEYINILNNLDIKCSGDWCINGNYSCINNNNECWKVEHIHDIQNSVLSNNGYDVNIYGNIIMSYGKWKNQLNHRVWNIVSKEKKSVYGDIFTYAKQNIIQCSKIQNTTDTQDIISLDEQLLLMGLCISVSINVILLIIIFCISCKLYNFHKNQRTVLYYNDYNLWNNG